MDPVVALAGEEHHGTQRMLEAGHGVLFALRPVLDPDALAALETGARGALPGAVLDARAHPALGLVRGLDVHPVHPADLTGAFQVLHVGTVLEAFHFQHLQHAIVQIQPLAAVDGADPAGGAEAVQAAVALVLGHEHRSGGHVHGGGLVLEAPHGRVRLGLAGRAARVAFMDLAVLDLLAGQPGAPGRGAAGAVDQGVLENRVGIHQLAVGAEAQRPDAAGHEFAVGHVHPAAIRHGEDRAAVRQRVPQEQRHPRHRLPASSGHQTQGEALRDHHPIHAGVHQRTDAGQGPGPQRQLPGHRWRFRRRSRGAAPVVRRVGRLAATAGATAGG